MPFVPRTGPGIGAIPNFGEPALFIAPQTTTFSPNAGALVLTGFAPSVQMSVSPAKASLLLTGVAPSIRTSVGPGVRSLSLTGKTPTISKSVSPAKASLSFTGKTPAIAKSVSPPVGSLTFNKFAPTVSFATVIIVPAAHFFLTGSTPDVDRIVRLPGFFTRTG